MIPIFLIYINVVYLTKLISFHNRLFYFFFSSIIYLLSSSYIGIFFCTLHTSFIKSFIFKLKKIGFKIHPVLHLYLYGYKFLSIYV